MADIPAEVWGPVHNEVTGTDLRVTGAIPDFLDGRYLRNGPNPVADVDPATYHLFSGDAMVHGISLRDGTAQWYRNRWVRTPVVCDALHQRPVVKPGGVMTAIGPNTNVIGHADRTIALVEGGMANYELGDELQTLGICDFDGTLRGGYSAHPHVDPQSGEMHAVSYAFHRGNRVQYSVIGTDGRARRTVDIDVHGQPMMHDFTLTEKYVVLYDLPVTLDVSMATASIPIPGPLRKPTEVALQSLIGRAWFPRPLVNIANWFAEAQPNVPYSWNPRYPARIGVLPRDGDNADVQWFEIEPCFIFHAINGYSETQDGHEVLVIDLVRYDTMFADDLLTPTGGSPRMQRWTIDLTRGSVSMTDTDDRWLEFPRINDGFVGKKHRYGYLPQLSTDPDHGWLVGEQLVKVDHTLGTSLQTSFDPAVVVGEMSFVPRPFAGTEDDGVLIGFASNRRENEGLLQILDAPTMETIASIHLPQRVPSGFHGNWLPRAG